MTLDLCRVDRVPILATVVRVLFNEQQGLILRPGHGVDEGASAGVAERTRDQIELSLPNLTC
jgi:hypothetical protein